MAARCLLAAVASHAHQAAAAGGALLPHQVAARLECAAVVGRPRAVALAAGAAAAVYAVDASAADHGSPSVAALLTRAPRSLVQLLARDAALCQDRIAFHWARAALSCCAPLTVSVSAHRPIPSPSVM